MRGRSAQVRAHIALSSTQEADKEQYEHTQGGRQAIAETLGSCVGTVHKCTPTMLQLSHREANKEQYENTRGGRQPIAETLGSRVGAVHKCTLTLL